MRKLKIIEALFGFSSSIRYVAIYSKEDLVYRQRSQEIEGASAGETDRFEELLVNPTLLKLAAQRGNIDCGGLDHLIVGYGNFHQLIKAIPTGHISICLEKDADLNIAPEHIFSYLKTNFSDLF